METLILLFGAMINFYYHCFDRIVINAYLSMLSREEHIVYFFRKVKGVSCITKDVLSQRTDHYNKWVEGLAGNKDIPIQWAEKGVRKEEVVKPFLKKMEREKKNGLYFIFKSMEQGTTFRSVDPKYPTDDPDYRIIKKCRRRFTYYYFYIRDDILGPFSMRVGTYLPFQVTCYLNGHNFIERELSSEGIMFKKKDNAIVSASDPQAVQDAADRLTPEVIQERLDLWIFRLGPKFSKHERQQMNLRRYYAIQQVEYCLNFIFQRNFPIRQLFVRSCELGLVSLTADKIANIFGWQVTRRAKGKLQTVLDRVDQGHHVLRAYFKNSFVKQYEKYRTFLRLEVVSNNLRDLRLKKSLENLPLVRQASLGVLDRFANAQACSLNAHFDFDLLEQLAQPVIVGKTRIAGIKLHEARIIRLMETLMHFAAELDGFTCRMIHDFILSGYEASDYTIGQLRYDLRKLKARGLIERNGKHYSYRLTERGRKVSTMFVLFHKRLFGSLANSLFNRRPDQSFVHQSPLEFAYHEADYAIERIIELLAA